MPVFAVSQLFEGVLIEEREKAEIRREGQGETKRPMEPMKPPVSVQVIFYFLLSLFSRYLSFFLSLYKDGLEKLGYRKCRSLLPAGLGPRDAEAAVCIGPAQASMRRVPLFAQTADPPCQWIRSVSANSGSAAAVPHTSGVQTAACVPLCCTVDLADSGGYLESRCLRK